VSFDSPSFLSFPRLRLERPTVAIVGGGASGVLTAVHLLRRRSPVRIVLVEERPRLGRGVAYDTTCAAHLLNVPAAGMSAFPGEPDHFLHWARSRRPQAHGGSFLPRRLYGEYLEWCLAEEIAAARRRTLFTAMQGRVTALVSGPGGAALRLAGGETLWASQVVLAMGNSAAPAHAGSASAPRGPIRDAWQPDAIADLPPGRPVVLIGTGLTAVDVMLSLEEAGFDGPIHAVSRRGLFPQPHVPVASPAAAPRPVPPRPAVPGAGATPGRARELVAALRAEVRLAVALGGDWRTVVDALRPRTQALWAALPEAERARLHRHALRYWEVHRHRMAPEVAERIERLRRSGRLRVTAGHVLSVTATSGGAAVTVRPRGARAAGTASSHPTELTLPGGVVIRCTGPREHLGSVGDPLLDGLFAGGDARPGPLGLGLAVDEHGRLLDRAGDPSDTLWALGPLRRGALLETTAIPEIREQAAALARILPEAAMAIEVGYALEEAL
jgi:uncharacterized NAD(P)/FAD-binding protein YdhS